MNAQATNVMINYADNRVITTRSVRWTENIVQYHIIVPRNIVEHVYAMLNVRTISVTFSVARKILVQRS